VRSVIIITFFISLFGCSNFRGLSSVESPEKEISVLGDLEGNITRFNDFIDKSEALYRNPDGSLQIRDGHHFVFLGDVMDRGPGSLRIMNDLISLKEQSPDNVTIILGNRDINKLRIMSLMDTNINKNVPEIVMPWFKKEIEDTHKVKATVENIKKYDTPLIRFKAFLKGMNAPSAFEFRRKELELINSGLVVDDMAVFTSFLGDYLEDGILNRYLNLGELAKIIDGNLFVHGAVTAENYGYIPNKQLRVNDAQEWVEQPHDWAHFEISDWFNNSKKGQELIKYHAPRKGGISNPLSVIYSRYSDQAGNPAAPNSKFIKKLRTQGISRIVVGHTPTGDFPIIVRKPNFELLLTDSSFSSIDKASKVTIRGTSVSVESSTPTGRKLIIESNVEDLNNPLGMKTTDGYRIIGRFEDSDELMALKVEGRGRKFNTKYFSGSPTELADRGLVEIFEQRVPLSCHEVMKTFMN